MSNISKWDNIQLEKELDRFLSVSTEDTLEGRKDIALLIPRVRKSILDYTTTNQKDIDVNQFMHVLHRTLLGLPLTPIFDKSEFVDFGDGEFYRCAKCPRVIMMKEDEKCFDTEENVTSFDLGDSFIKTAGSMVEVTLPYYVPETKHKYHDIYEVEEV